jgi:hypothetical protein
MLVHTLAFIVVRQVLSFCFFDRKRPAEWWGLR